LLYSCSYFRRSRFVARRALLMRVRGGRSAHETTTSRDAADTPSTRKRCSPSEWSGSDDARERVKGVGSI
jgi:hypothetical protein